MKSLKEIPMTLESWKPSTENSSSDKIGPGILYLVFSGDVGEKTLAQFFDSKDAYKQFESTVWDEESEELKNELEKVTLGSSITGGTAQIFSETARDKPFEWDRVNLDSVVLEPSAGKVAHLKFRLRVYPTSPQVAKLFETQKWEYRVSIQRPTAAQEREMAKEKEKQGNLALPRPKEDDGKLSKKDAEKILDGKAKPKDEVAAARKRRNVGSLD